MRPSDGSSAYESKDSHGNMKNKWRRIMRRRIKELHPPVHQPPPNPVKSTTTSILDPIPSEATVVCGPPSKIQLSERRPRTITNLVNTPVVPSPYDDKMRKMLQSTPTLLSNRVHISWYRRFADVLPEKEQTNFQPFREIQTRDEDIALQHQYGSHECMQDLVQKGTCRVPPGECKRIREHAMARYTRIKKKEEERREKGNQPPNSDELTFREPGQDIDLTTEFGFSANKKKLVCPVVEFLMKLHVNRERAVARRSITKSSHWHLLSTPQNYEKIRGMVLKMKRAAARNRIQRLFHLVLCVDRFIKCVAMIAGDTQTLLNKKKTVRKPHISHKAHQLGESKSAREMNIFDVHNFEKVGQVSVPFHIQMILTKPWFCRTNKEIEVAVSFLEKMRCFTAYPRQFQFMLAKVAWYIELPTQKVIIRQCQQAVNFYLLLNGSVRIDRLEGSPCADNPTGHFKTLSTLSSQDMFGDECITNPLGERWYTATSEEKCAVLDFNMHDYNGMIQTANLSEEAPDHIRFLCKLRIMDNFPKIKLLQEQDTNVTYFFFRPDTLVCKSVRDSPYVFVIRNGSCSSLLELMPKMEHKKSWGLFNPNPNSSTPPHRDSRRISDSARTSIMVQLLPGNLQRASRKLTIKPQTTSEMFEGIVEKIKEEDSRSQWLEKTKHAFEHSKAGIKDQMKTMAERTENLVSTVSDEMLDTLNLGSASKKSSKENLSTDTRRSSGRNSQLRWRLGGGHMVEAAESDADVDTSRQSGASFPEFKDDPMPNQTGFRGRARAGSMVARSSFVDGSTSGSSGRRSIAGSFLPRASFFEGSTSGGSPGDSQGGPRRHSGGAVPRASQLMGSTVGGTKTPKIVGTQIPISADAILQGSGITRRSRGNSFDQNNSAQAWQAQLSSTAAGTILTKDGKKLKLPTIKTRRPTEQFRSSINRESQARTRFSVGPPAPSKYSQWKQKALLTVTDVVGVEWLDYNDGNYKQPTEDTSLVSHGATIIMIKKDFMLKYLKKSW